MACLPKPRDFQVVHLELESNIALLKNTFRPKVRVKLLRELRLLVEQADIIMQMESE